jgi:hypothetical protein
VAWAIWKATSAKRPRAPSASSRNSRPRKAESELFEWKEAAGPLTKDDFVEYGKAAVEPGFDYYKGLYNDPSGEMYQIKEAFRAATVFNALVLAELTLPTAELLVDDLKHFGFNEFTGPFLENLKRELPLLLQHARKPFDWSALPGAAAYDLRLKRELERKAKSAGAASAASTSSLPAETIAPEEPERSTLDEVTSWRDDPSEKARRIWAWWVVRVKGPAAPFKYWPTALRLVALVQPSSAAVERLFSQLKLILDQIGDNALEESIEGRLFTRFNALAGL